MPYYLIWGTTPLDGGEGGGAEGASWQMFQYTLSNLNYYLKKKIRLHIGAIKKKAIIFIYFSELNSERHGS